MWSMCYLERHFILQFNVMLLNVLSWSVSVNYVTGHCPALNSQWTLNMSLLNGGLFLGLPIESLIYPTLFQPVCRPPVPSHRVPPYRAVSARLRPCVFSQSTPIGLDRMGRRKGRRVLSGECDFVYKHDYVVDLQMWNEIILMDKEG